MSRAPRPTVLDVLASKSPAERAEIERKTTAFFAGAAQALAPHVDHETPRAELIDAIRTFTVDLPDGHPNGETERQIERLRGALEAGDLEASRDAFRAMMNALSDDTFVLRVAASAFFGEDFRAKDAIEAARAAHPVEEDPPQAQRVSLDPIARGRIG